MTDQLLVGEVKFFSAIVPVELAYDPARLAKEGERPIGALDKEALKEAHEVVRRLIEWYEHRQKWDAMPFRLTDG